MNSGRIYLRVAVPCPLYRSFDYLPPSGSDAARLMPGLRIQIPFGRTTRVGVLLETATHSDVPVKKLRPATAVLDARPLIGEDLLQLARWAAEYYHHPVGEVLEVLFPGLLRQGRAAELPGEPRWRLTASGRATPAQALARAPRQRGLLEMLHAAAAGLEQTVLAGTGWQPALRALRDKGLVESFTPEPMPPAAAPTQPGPALNAAQSAAADTIIAHFDRFHAFLVDGITGSGKTEVYLRTIQAALDRGRQVLVLVPEIGLTPQAVARFRQRLGVPIAVFHSGLRDSERLTAWLQAQRGLARVLIGTRSAVWTPLPELGLIIVDEEHDSSYKQQEGFRYSARDLAVLRAQRGGVPVVLGSATPALESLHNVNLRRYERLHLPERAGVANHPSMTLLDVRSRPMRDGLSDLLLDAMRRHLDADGQVLLFLNRRGYAPTLLCHACGWIAQCARCDARLTLHHGRNRLCCHHCGSERAVPQVCDACGSLDLQVLGKGTERLEAGLAERFPGIGIARVDRDTTQRKGALDTLLREVESGARRILIGTQMLAKGHDFPDITLVGVVDADQGLFSVDFRAAERMAQLITQVAGRAGRADKPGEVLIQTHHPEHPLLQTLVREGYAHFAAAALAERHAARLPPYTSLALLRAEATERAAPLSFLRGARQLAEQLQRRGSELLGPAPAPMERRAGRYRAQLLVQADRRTDLQELLADWVPKLAELPQARRVRWSVDVDPQEMF